MNHNNVNQSKMNGASLTGLALLGGVVGAAIGYGAGVLASPKQREEHREKLERLRQRFSEVNVEELSQKMFGKTTKEVKQSVRATLNNFQAKLGDLQESFQNLDEAKYQAFVDNFVDTLTQEQQFEPEQVDTLRRYLRDDFKIMKRRMIA